MPDHTVSITLQALDSASPNIRQAREELERLLATADQINAASAAGLFATAASPALTAGEALGVRGAGDAALPDPAAAAALAAASGSLRDDLAAAALTSADLADALSGATAHTDALRTDMTDFTGQLRALTSQVQVVRVRLAVEDPAGVLSGGAAAAAGLGQATRDNGGVTPGVDRRRFGGDAP
jgi:hypothetical protein